MASNPVTVKDNGYKAFLKGVNSLKGLRVKVGIQAAEASEVREGGITMVDLATIHEFGYEPFNIPQRSFLRSTADANRAKYERRMAKSVAKLTKNPKGTSAKRELFLLGEIVRGDIIKRIKSRIPPANEPATIAGKKGEDVPLIDEGLLIGSIRSVVV